MAFLCFENIGSFLIHEIQLRNFSKHNQIKSRRKSYNKNEIVNIVFVFKILMSIDTTQ